MAEVSGKSRRPVDIFLEEENMELECELAFPAACFWARSCWEGKWADDMYGAWKKQIFNAGSRSEAQGPAKAVRCELRNAGMQWPAWDTFAAGDTLPDCRVIAPSGIEKFLAPKEQTCSGGRKKSKLMRWRMGFGLNLSELS